MFKVLSKETDLNRAFIHEECPLLGVKLLHSEMKTIPHYVSVLYCGRYWTLLIYFMEIPTTRLSLTPLSKLQSSEQCSINSLIRAVRAYLCVHFVSPVLSPSQVFLVVLCIPFTTPFCRFSIDFHVWPFTYFLPACSRFRLSGLFTENQLCSLLMIGFTVLYLQLFIEFLSLMIIFTVPLVLTWGIYCFYEKMLNYQIAFLRAMGFWGC